MAGLKTRETDKDVFEFIESIENQAKREDSKTLLAFMQEITGEEPRIWGDNFIIGFGKYRYKRKGGKETYERFHVGFAPRKTNLSVYLSCDITQHEELLRKLGKCKWGKGCLYINKLADIDLQVLRQLIEKNNHTQGHNNK